jgi:2',3'-cyclic-nucleotide 2'-phosphodiesterase (5'-nucleotidase family)
MNPRRVMRVTLLLLLVAVAGCASNAPVRELTILHVNDLHARLNPDAEGRGGFAYLATLLDQQREAAPHHLTLDAGDLVQGTPVSTIFQGRPVFEIANHLGIDVSSPGNHEFDYGWRRIAEFESIARFDLISSNVVDDAGRHLFRRAYVMRRVNGLDVAIVGAMTGAFDSVVTTRRRGPWHVAPVIETLRPLVERLSRRADLVIVLGHLGLDEQEAVLRALPEVAVVIGGHDHEGRDRPLELDGRVALSVPAYGRALGRLDLQYDRSAHRVVSYRWDRLAVDSRALAPDPTVQRLVDDWEARVSSVVDVAIARAERKYGRADMRRLVEQALRDATGASVAYTEIGWIRDEIAAGTVLLRHVWNVMPFDNAVVLVRFAPGRAPPELAVRPDFAADPTQVVVTADYEAERWRDRGFEPDVTVLDLEVRDVIAAKIRQEGVLR